MYKRQARPRAGLIRVREFTMKDAYSFHTSTEDLEAYYLRCHRAYERIFARAGIPEVLSVASDSGMMGGSLSHEFMLLTPAGEDSIVLCSSCGYRANMEAAECITQNCTDAVPEPLTPVETPDIHTIEAVSYTHLIRCRHIPSACRRLSPPYPRPAVPHRTCLLYTSGGAAPDESAGESGKTAGAGCDCLQRGTAAVYYGKRIGGMK